VNEDAPTERGGYMVCAERSALTLVLPSEVEESLTVLGRLRDVSTSLDMTERWTRRFSSSHCWFCDRCGDCRLLFLPHPTQSMARDLANNEDEEFFVRSFASLRMTSVVGRHVALVIPSASEGPHDFRLVNTRSPVRSFPPLLMAPVRQALRSG